MRAGAADAVSEAPLQRLLEELQLLLVERSIRYGDFTLASGARSHYYCDAKLTLLSPRGARLCGEALCRVLEVCDAEAVGGLAMGAAYVAAGVAQASAGRDHRLYGFTVRSERKEHGRGQKIDESWHPGGGPLLGPGRRVAVVDDVVTTGSSTVKAIEAVQSAGCEVRVVAAILDRQAGGAERFAGMGLPFYSLFVADETGTLSIGELPAGLL